MGVDTCAAPQKSVFYPILMKTVGKQLQEARLARNWTPELASRETKIKVDRLKDLESDDYSHFNNATYARGFVRTYARALGLDEYTILRQLDNKLPDDDSANIVSAEGGVAYLPETAMPPRVAHKDLTALYVVMALGAAVMLLIVFVLFRAYQVGELGKWTGEDSVASAGTGSATVAADDQSSPKKALPIDSDTPPPTPAPEAVQTGTATTDESTANAPKALPVDLNAPTAGAPKALPVDPATLGNTPSPAPAPADIPANAPKALPVDPSTLVAANVTPAPTAPADIPANAPKALPVDPATLNAPTPAPADVPVNAPKALPVSPADLAAASGGSSTQAPASNGPVVLPAANVAATATDDGSGKTLVLTASHDSFVRVTTLDAPGGGKQVYAEVLHSGQSVAFNGHKFSVAVNNPSAVDFQLDGVNYGPHDGTDPATYTIVSHVQ